MAGDQRVKDSFFAIKEDSFQRFISMTNFSVLGNYVGNFGVILYMFILCIAYQFPILYGMVF